MHFAAILDGQDDVWGVRIPDLPGCHGGGATADEAIADATSAAREWIEHQLARGAAIPTPRGLDQIRRDPREEFDPVTEALVLIPALATEPA